jgi:septal ring factor EnvC (AmiA/AmiB activator)
MSKPQINKVHEALKSIEKELQYSSHKIKIDTKKLERCKKKIKEHIEKIKNIKEALIKNKMSANMMIHEGYIENLDEYTEYINAIFNSLIHSADNILDD